MPTATAPPPRPAVSLVRSAYNYVLVQYDRAMRDSGAGAANVLSAYLLDGGAFPAGSTIFCASATCDVVRIDMPQPLASGSSHTLTVRGVVSAQGALLNPDPAVAAFRTDTQGG